MTHTEKDRVRETEMEIERLRGRETLRQRQTHRDR